MLKAVFVGVLILVVGFLLTSEVILPMASVILQRPDLDTWTGLGLFLHLLGGLLVLFLVAAAVRAVYHGSRGDE